MSSQQAGEPDQLDVAPTGTRKARAPDMATAGPKRWLFDAWSLFYDLPWVQRAVYRSPHDAVVRILRELVAYRVAR